MKRKKQLILIFLEFLYVNVGDDVYVVRIYVLWNDCFIVSIILGRLLFVGWKLL